MLNNGAGIQMTKRQPVHLLPVAEIAARQLTTGSQRIKIESMILPTMLLQSSLEERLVNERIDMVPPLRISVKPSFIGPLECSKRLVAGFRKSLLVAIR